MLPSILLTITLTVGQPAPTTDPATPDAPASDERWFLMKSLQGTRFGNNLDAHKIQISGWTHLSFTASSAASEQLPMGFNYRANEFLLQQNW